MRMGITSSLMALLVGAGTALAQPPEAPAPSTPGPLPPALAPTSAAPAPFSSCTPAQPASFADGGGAPCGPGNGLPDYGPGFGPAPMGNVLYGSAEYLLWKIKDAPLPPSQLTVPFTVTGLNSFSNTFTLANGAGIEYAGRSGGRFTFGAWVQPDQILGLEATYFQFDQHNDNFAAFQVANLPQNLQVTQNITVTSTINGAIQETTSQVPLAITLPAQLTTTVSGAAGPSSFWGVEANARSLRCVFGGASIDLIGGFRYLEFDENFSLFESAVLQTANATSISSPGSIPPNPIPPIPQPITGLKTLATINTNDFISTRNQFYGAQVGTSFDWWLFPRFVIAGWGKVGTGAMVETINITGATTTIPSTGGAGSTSAGGLLTPGVGLTNDSRTRYVVIPEFNINVGYQVTSRLRMMVGYNFLYISNVARPGDQIGFSSSTASIAIQGSPTPVTVNTPSYSYHTTDLWAQGLTAGFQLRY